MPRPELHRGRIAKHPRVLSVRPLTRDDLGCLQEKRVGPPRLKALRASHHRVARLIALGYKTQHVADMTGYSASRITALQQDPAFSQLVTEMTNSENLKVSEAVDEIKETEADTMLVASKLINDRIHLAAEDPENSPIPLRDLMALTGDRYDRFGYGKKSTQTNEVYDFAAMMAQMAQKSGRSNVIDAKAAEVQDSADGGFRQQIRRG